MNVTEIQIREPEYPDLSSDIIYARFPVTDPQQSDPFILTGESGLDADDITVMVAGIVDGYTEPPYVNLYDMKMNPRTVTLKLKLNPDYNSEEPVSVGDLRDELYKCIFRNRRAKVELRFIDGETNVASLIGFVTKVEGDKFAISPETTITFEFEDPFLRCTDYITLSAEVLPFPLPSLTDDSTAPHGFQLILEFTDSESGISISGITGELLESPDATPFVITYDFLEDDLLYFSSEYNNKYLYVVRDDVVTNLVDKISADSVWPILFPGLNTLFASGDFVANELKYRNAYWGV